VQCFHGYSLGFLAFLLRRWVGSGSASVVDWFPSMCASLLAFFLNLPLLSRIVGLPLLSRIVIRQAWHPCYRCLLFA
jgi:hypothetical protein